MDAVFIFIFFLLTSANFITIYEIPSDVPIISDKEPPKSKQKPLALTLKIYTNRLSVFTGVPSRQVKSFGKNSEGKYNTQALHNYLITLKKKNLKENTIIFEPKIDMTYEDLIKVMDSARILESTDPALWVKDKDGLDKRLKTLFSNIVFGNIQS